ncbi:MAG: MMPL family transporter [Planctomycetaceae bacterium]
MATDEKPACGLFARCLGGIVGFGARRPRLALWSLVLLGCAAVGITAIDLKLQTSRAELLPADPAWEDYTKNFGGESDVTVVVQSDVPNAPMIQTALLHLSERLEREPEYFSSVLCRLNQQALRSKALQLQSTSRLKDAQWLAEYIQYGEQSGNWNHLRLDQWARFLTDQVDKGNAADKPSSNAIAYAERLSSSLNDFVQTESARSPWPEFSSPALEASAQDADLAFLMNHQGTAGFLRVTPAVPSPESPTTENPIARLRYHVAEVQKAFKDEASHLNIALTGISVLESDELRHSGADIGLAAAVAFLAVALLLSLGLRGMRHPMLVLVTLVNALAITFGIVTLAVGHLSIMSICFVAITIGLGVDFGIHFVNRYLHLRQELYELEESLVLTGRSIGTGIFTSAATTAIAFGSAVLTGHPGLAELGIITALGVLVCALLSLTFLPALIALSDGPVEVDELPVPIDGRMWRSAVAGFPLSAIAVSVLGIAAIAWHAIDFDADNNLALKVRYDSNLLRLQDDNLDSVQAERRLAQAQESLLYAVAIAESRDEADELRAQFLSLPTVDRVTDLAGKLPPAVGSEKSVLIRTLASASDRVQKIRPTTEPPKLESVGQSLKALQLSLAESSDIRAKKTAMRLQQAIEGLAAVPNQQRHLIDSYQDYFVTSLMKQFQQVGKATSLDPISAQDLPDAWRQRYVKTDGERELWLLKIYPREDVWNEASLASFVGEVRTVSPTVTGVPVRNFESSAKMKECYQMIGLYSLAAIGLFLLFDFLRPGQKLLTLIPPMLVVGFVGYTAVQRQGELNPHLLVGIYLAMVGFIATVFDFRNLRDTLIALIPPIGGGLMLLGLMALLHVDFNPINLIVLPLVLGIGVDDGIHMVHDYRRQLADRKDEYTPSGDTVNGVLLTSLTSIVGFGSLMVADHQGLKSVGVVLALGVACCLAVALILVPPLLVLVARHQPASLEPIPIRLRSPKTGSESGTTDSDGSGNGNGNSGERPLTRKEKRRQAAA